ncbi:MAG: TIGR02996 domain-containing protein, partial [Gemmataceae bacterium]|nr:TIGR02996 domain-containing protein [Gemmataceae bacterium]
MDTQDILLDDIAAHPDDDALRRIYADWLEDQGDSERAEFIRVQLDLARLDEGDERWPALESRCARLLGEHREEWLGPAPHEGADWTFHRGFPEQVEIDGPLAQSRLLRLLPAPVRSLALRRAKLSPEDLRALLASAPLDRLEHLDLAGNPLGSEGVRVLLESPVARHLRRLGLSHAGINANAVELLCGSDAFAGLQSLDLGGNELGAAATPFLAGARHLSSLRRLVLDRNRLAPTSVRDLAQSSRLRGLRCLSIRLNPLGSDGIAELCRDPSFPDLEELGLAGTQLTAPALGQLGPLLGRLRVLDLEGNPIGSSGIEALMRCKAVPPLAHLDLHRCEIGDEGAKALARWPALAALRELSLGCN